MQTKTLKLHRAIDPITGIEFPTEIFNSREIAYYWLSNDDPMFSMYTDCVIDMKIKAVETARYDKNVTIDFISPAGKHTGGLTVGIEFWDNYKE